MSALERATGVPRSTIHFYISEELLPRPAKTASSRSLYSENHVELLRRITILKQSGLSLAEIKEELEPVLARASENWVDLAAHEYERIHAEIIKAATEEFVAKGYEDTHLATIVKKIGTTPHVFYSHFDSKLHLLAECFRVIMESSFQSVEPKLETNLDLVERLLARLASDPARHVLRAEAVSLIRATSDTTSDASNALVQTYARIVERVAADIRAMHPAGAPVAHACVALPRGTRCAGRPSRHRQRG
jgi:DNA-binding transcriptional MerR regulator